MPRSTSNDVPNSPPKSLEKDLSTLKSNWTTLYKQTLPSLARSKAPSQPHWPVHLDHCFARIILDAVIGNSTSSNTTGAIPSPWTERIASPAIQHMTAQQLQDCITLGEAIADGKSNLAELDQQSLTVRGKSKAQSQNQKRKTAPQSSSSSSTPPSSKKQKPPPKPKTQPDIRTALGLPTPSPLHNQPCPTPPHRPPQSPKPSPPKSASPPP
ncbi:hypothetical protein N7G274_000403 [Stereocaulon virgatum]|uniref:Uncharacterized protein n=1 Tax=Stereocaulon virgatum TaxID=373712 RepID=A0ABR4ASF2_9LECA